MKSPEMIKELRQVNSAFERAVRIRPTMHMQLARLFGKRSVSKAMVNNRDYVSYRDTLIQIVKDKYVIRLPENSTAISDIKEAIVEAIATELVAEPPRKPHILKFPDQKPDLITDVCNQPKAAKTLWDNIVAGKRGQWLVAPAGIGKTFILANVIKNFVEQKMVEECKCYSPWPVIYITKMSVVEQTKGVLRLFGLSLGDQVCVFNIETLRTDFGRFFVDKDLMIIGGREIYAHTWNPKFLPALIIWDECHILAREESEQSKIACSLNDVESQVIYQIGASATAMSRVSETKHFIVSTRIKYFLGKHQTVVSNKNWHQLANQLSYPFHPSVYAEGSVKNFMEKFKDHIVQVEDIKLKFHSHIDIKTLSFKNKAEKELYDNAIEDFYIKKAKIEGSRGLSEAQMNFAILAEFTILRKAIESIRAESIADAVNYSYVDNKAPAVGAAFKQTIVKIYQFLVNKHGWKREDVSFIWGGSTEALNDKQKLHKQIQEKVGKDKLEQMGISYADLGLDLVNLNEKTNEQYEFEKKHKLLSQKPEERERERMRFQRQDSRCLLFSYKSGGVGLSAHHERMYPKARPREDFFTPIY